MFNIGPQELLMILVVALLFVGPKRLPELGRTIGRGLSELRKAQTEVQRTIRGAIDEPQSSAPTSPPQSSGNDRSGNDRSGAGSSATSDESPSTRNDEHASDAARMLGQGLSELRRAREQIQRTFHIDLDDHSGPAD